MRYSLLLISFLALPTICTAQVPEDSGDGGGMVAPRAQPAEAQDAEAARERLLKAADQLDLMQSNAETAKVAMEQMKSDIAQLQTANADLKQQLSALQASFDRAEATRAKERDVLLNEVAQVMAIKTSRSSSLRDETTTGESPSSSTQNDDTEVHHAKKKLAEADANPAPSAKSHKGYYHVVESGETLTMICAAYRADGVKVSLAQVRKANGLGSKSSLKVGQKLFIPQPGT